eukprot:Hpha_TRINITY_DN30333_c0_g1::TRINITY_DN30333_c0_g1_i1::g.147147::m.147147
MKVGTLAVVLACLAGASGKLVKVIVLGRHGNRAPNPQVPWVCPAADEMLKEFDQPVWSRQRAALSKVGHAENWEAGRWIRSRYGEGPDALVEPYYKDDGSIFFFSERMNRNIVSTQALVYGLFPPGTGQPGFIEGNPNLVPILTSQPFEDTLINMPRDGPCTSLYNRDRAIWNQRYEKEYASRYKTTIDKFSGVCGYDFTTSRKSLAWSLKAAADAFSMAKNEGIDYTRNGTIDPKLIDSVLHVSAEITNSQRFSEPHQVTYWVGRFAEDALFVNMKPTAGELLTVGQAPGSGVSNTPWQDDAKQWFDRNKLQVYMNHRELFVSLARVFGFHEMIDASPPPGSMVVWEVHEEDANHFLDVFLWTPSQPTWEQKHAVLQSGTPVATLYDTGSVVQMQPGACKGERCTLEHFQAALAEWTSKTGTWQEVCGLSSSAKEFFAEQRVMEEDGDDFDGWRHVFERLLFPSPLKGAEHLGEPRQPVLFTIIAVVFGVVVGHVGTRIWSRRGLATPAQRQRPLYGTC